MRTWDQYRVALEAYGSDEERLLARSVTRILTATMAALAAGEPLYGSDLEQSALKAIAAARDAQERKDGTWMAVLPKGTVPHVPHAVAFPLIDYAPEKGRVGGRGDYLTTLRNTMAMWLERGLAPPALASMFLANVTNPFAGLPLLRDEGVAPPTTREVRDVVRKKVADAFAKLEREGNVAHRAERHVIAGMKALDMKHDVAEGLYRALRRRGTRRRLSP